MHIKQNRAATYPLLTVLILQFALSSLMCATVSYAADSITLCTSLGLKTVKIDADGNPIENDSQHAGFESHCFHCATGCTNAALIAPAQATPHRVSFTVSYSLPKQSLNSRHLTRGPPPRGPPHTV